MPPKRAALSQIAHPPLMIRNERRGRRNLSTVFSKLFWFGSAAVGVVSVFMIVGYYDEHRESQRITMKCELPPVSKETDQRVWGTYRSHMYFGLRARHNTSPLFGMMWYRQPKIIERERPQIRHWCEQGNGVTRFAWTQADGRTFGRQTISDKSLDIFTDWINNGPVWTARITTTSNTTTNFALLFYFVLQDDRSKLHAIYRNGTLDHFTGKTDVLGRFRVDITTTVDVRHRSFLALRTTSPPDVSSMETLILMSTLTDYQHRLLRLPSAFISEGIPESEPHIIVLQLNVQSNSLTEIAYTATGEPSITGQAFTNLLEERTKIFDEKFENVYNLAAKGYPAFYQDLGKVALSNMLGTIGYVYGSNRVKGCHSSAESFYGPHSLFSTCPSRSFFPRGFLWDEGFHQLLLRRFDPDLSLEIIASWLDTMNIDGWIPREMILGKEAELRVPAEFVIQRNTLANPPMFFYVIEKYLDDTIHSAQHKDVLKGFYPRLSLWYKWLNSTQAGKKRGTYRWRGRNMTTEEELNPRTLPSGLDDFPRATHPNDDEYHIDLRCWMALSSRVLSWLAELVGDAVNEARYTADYNFLSDQDLLEKLHWSAEKKRFCDYGYHSNNVQLQKQIDYEKIKNDAEYSAANAPVKRVVKSEPKKQLVEDAFGYVSLFPVLLRLLPPSSDKLKIILENLKSHEELWSNFGLRSISASSPYYDAYNTAHDPPYWRGAVWININYLMLSALKHYSSFDGPSRNIAYQLYVELRNNLIVTVAHEYRRTGFIWENYDDVTGRGRGAHPFTGWSSLILSIMAERYD